MLLFRSYIYNLSFYALIFFSHRKSVKVFAVKASLPLRSRARDLLGLSNEGTYRITISFLNSITVRIIVKYFHIHSKFLETEILPIMSVPYECYFFLNLETFFTNHQLDYYTHKAVFFCTLSLSSHPFHILILYETILSL